MLNSRLIQEKVKENWNKRKIFDGVIEKRPEK